MNERFGVGVAILSCSFGAGAAVATRYLVGGADPVTIAAIRFGGGALCLWPLALALRVAWPRARDRISGQQRRLGIRLVEILDDGERLDQRLAVVERERRHAPLRIDGAKVRAVLLTTAPGEMDRRHLVGEALEVERDPGAVRGRKRRV